MNEVKTVDLGRGRIAKLVSGYNCGPNGENCQHEHKGNHGQHPDEWHFVVGAGTRAALVLRVCTNIRDGKALEGYELPHGTDLDLHTTFPVGAGEDDIDQLFEKKTPCDYVKGGGCHNGWRSTVGTARDFWQKWGFVCFGFAGQLPEFWEALEGVRAMAFAVAKDRHLGLKFKVCPCCKGKRVVRRKGK